MTQIAEASDGKLKIGSCQREDVVDVMDAEARVSISQPTIKRGERGFKAILAMVSDNLPKH